METTIWTLISFKGLLQEPTKTTQDMLIYDLGWWDIFQNATQKNQNNHERIYVCCQHCSHQMSHLEPVFQAPIITLALAMGISRSGPRVFGIGSKETSPRNEREKYGEDGDVSSHPIFEDGRDEQRWRILQFFKGFFWNDGVKENQYLYILIWADSVGDIFLCRIFVWFCLSLGWLKYTTENQFGAAFLSPFPASDGD